MEFIPQKHWFFLKKYKKRVILGSKSKKLM